MSRGVDQVEIVRLAVCRSETYSHGVSLDSDTPLPLDVHRVEDLVAHFALSDGTGSLQQPIGKRRLAVIDVCND